MLDNKTLLKWNLRYIRTRGHLEILQAGTGKSLGFVRNTFNPFGEYARTTEENERLVVEIKLPEADRGPVNIATLVSSHSSLGGY